ncbi:hypothetical protein [Variovorax sp. dw_308]|uniref:hypothetical protein n=1 Tax=Variovorax sp. dw_308 TaxID=2721546 RepID=UPI001C462B37|nr:hypothetical protein [Variovorax sp. dw_308]
MPEHAENLKLAISLVALAISLISLYFTRVNWIQSNRPVVSAFVTEHASGSNAATFNLVLANTGNRPAVRVRLVAPHESIRRLVEPSISEKRFKMIEHNFLSRSEVPLLRNGEELVTSFGAFTPDDPEGKWLNYGAETEVTIRYSDLEGRVYVSKQPIKVYAREGFGGGVWG